jgi:hypothetical protein
MARPTDPLEILDRAAKVLSAHDHLAELARFFAAFATTCAVGGILLERARVQRARCVAWQSRVCAATKRHMAARQGIDVDLTSEEWAALYQLTVDEWPVVVAHSRFLALHGVSRETKKGSES